MLAAGHIQSSPVAMTPTPVDSNKRRHSKPSGSGSSNKRKKKTQTNQMSTKDLGRWKPTDDLALIIGVQQTNDLRMVHRGIKFSCRFTVNEIQSRWYTLLYNAEISRIAVTAMKNLHPDLVTAVRSKALFSNGEEELLSTISSTSHPNLESFQELLEQNPTIFYPTRTAKSLMAHWQLLKQYSLLPDQSVQALPIGDNVLNFSDAEDAVNDTELQEPRDEALETELCIADRWAKKEIRLLENSLGRWQVLVESVVGGITPDFDKQTLAVLRGRLVRYLMRSREITIGRNTNDHHVDVDLSLEGPAGKISRRQGTIRLRNSGDFFLASEGKRPFYIDGRPILRGNKVKLNHNSVIEISGLRFVFLINQDLVNAIRQESVKVNVVMP
ncbi:microspherule protein Rcd5 isoform X2 [Arctopsyche grandis]